MFDEPLRALKSRALYPLVRVVARLTGALPLTLLSLGAGLASALVIGLDGPLTTAFALWILNRLLDGLDGEVARVRGEQNDFGGYADMIADVATYAAVPVALAFRIGSETVAISIVVLLAAFYLNITSWSYLAALLEKRRLKPAQEVTSITMPRGLIEGGETVVLYSVMILFPATIGPAALIASAACVVSVAWRIGWAYHVLKE